MAYAPNVFSRFSAARRADSDRIPPRAVPIAEALPLDNRPATTVPDAELCRLLEGLPDDTTPAAYDEDQVLGRLARTAQALHTALDVRAAATDGAAGHDDPTAFMAGARGPAVQVRRIGAAWEDGEPGLLILPGEVVEYDGTRMRIVRPAPDTAKASV